MTERLDLWSALDQIADQEWTLSENGMIRNTKMQCPVCALSDILAGRPLDLTTEFMTATNRVAEITGLRTDFWSAVSIANAADLPEDGNRAALMNRLGMPV